jgi:hypothetical protein
MGVLHQGMGEAHFGSINSTIAGGFDDGKERREVRIQYDTVDEVLARDENDDGINAQRRYLN